MSFQVTYSGSIHLPDHQYWLDPRHPVPLAFISHAHFDHFSAHQHAHASQPTAHLISCRTDLSTTIDAWPWATPQTINTGLQATLYPAGHVLGSAMIELNDGHQSLLYTGDFKLRDSLTAEKAAPPRADILIMETTYGLPHYVMPPTEKTVRQILDFCRATLEDDETPVLLAYSLGKTQELLARLTPHLDVPFYLHPQAYKIAQAYEQLGYALGSYAEIPHSYKKRGEAVILAPPQMNGTAWMKNIPARRVALISGWALDPGAIYRYRCDAAFPLSDHADYNELLELVRMVKPRRVYTVHGFAVEFAETLRQLGIEAWALGQENQLDFFEQYQSKRRPNFKSLSLPSRKKIIAREPDPETFLAFAQAAEEIAELSSKKSKVRVLAQYLAKLSSTTLPLAALYFSGRVYPTASSRTLNFSWSLMKRAVLEVAECTESDFKEIYRSAGDSATTTECLLEGKTKSEPWPLTQVAQWFELISNTSGSLQKVHIAANTLRCITPLEAKYLSKLVTGDLRLGLKEGLVEEGIAAAFSQPLRLVREALLLCGDIGRVALAAQNNSLPEVTLQVFNPIPFMLATPLPTAASIIQHMGQELWAEYKYDGIRCQIHKQGARVELYSRELRCITDTFPEIAIDAASLPFDFIADGEVLGWQQGRPLPFTQLQRRLGRQEHDLFLGSEIPVALILYDCLYWEGESLLHRELRERKAFLSRLAENPRPTILVAQEKILRGEAALEAFFQQARLEGHEGLMIKNPRSLYTIGQRGQFWIKYKQPFNTLDVVVVAVQYGHGKRRGMLSDYTFAVRDDDGQLHVIGKAYSGLTNREIEALTQHFLATTIREEEGRLIVKPTVVLEVAFNAITPSSRYPCGLALRFPRIVTIRHDKTPEEIDTLSFCRSLAYKASGSES
ncbi:MAG: ATP-dependent DNA ligase [Methylacidiphilales bacterium]|nr:ATP-dependent DNA ligase [Candidatus Methylacidiphilales bacterium]MDW8349084.1 ATP-dependent DNA ligase [Verrucomicrobiae bacterium]